MASKIATLWNHPAGPKTIHFWAPTCKWGISIANIADFSKPPEVISYPQQLAVTATGIIWSRYSMVIIPKNWNLFSVNIAMGVTGIYQLSRKIQQDYMGVPDAPQFKKNLLSELENKKRPPLRRLGLNYISIFCEPAALMTDDYEGTCLSCSFRRTFNLG